MHQPFFREAGSGPGVVCLHANASSSTQWRKLMEDLSGRYHVVAPDLFGAGRSPSWPAAAVRSLSEEIALLEPVFASAGQPHALVGHSFGAALALVAAVQRPDRVRAIAVYEPVLFSLVDAASPPPNDADGIRGAVAASCAALEAGEPSEAARGFIDYWMGNGAWAEMPESRQRPIVETISGLPGWSHALLSEPAPLAAFSTLDIPVLYMTGRRSPASSRAVAKLLTQALPRVEAVEFDALGHMAPVTHPAPVNEVISRFLDREMT